MKISNKRILSLLSAAAFVVVVSPAHAALEVVSGDLEKVYDSSTPAGSYNGVGHHQDGAGVNRITHTVKDGATIGSLVGGINISSGASGTGNDKNFTADTLKGGITINVEGGTITSIVGGNTISEGSQDYANGSKTMQNVGPISINISGGTIGVQGGGEAIMAGGGRYCGSTDKITINISQAEGKQTIINDDIVAGANGGTAGSTEVNISGGTINANVYGGGRKDYGSVGSTAINISGGTINADVYGGSMDNQQTGSTTITMTGNAEVTGTIHGGSDGVAAGDAEKVGSRTLDLGTGDAAYTGSVNLDNFTDVNVNNGSTTIESMSGVSNVTVGSAGVLNVSANTLQVDNAVTVNGTLNVDMEGDDATASGQTLTLGNGAKVNVLNAPEGSESVSVFGFDTVNMAEDVVLTLNGASVSSDMWELQGGALTIKEATAATLNLSRNQSKFYNALQAYVAGGNAAPQFAELANSRDSQFVKDSIDSISGHEYATAMSSQLEGNLGHLRRLRGAMGKGTALGVSTSYAPTGAKGAEVPMTESCTRNWRAGVSVFHEEMNVSSDARGDGYERSETGAMVNAEYYVKDTLSLGGAISYGRTNLRTDGAARRHEDNTRFDVYALYGKKRWNFATSVGLGLHEHELGSADVDGFSINFMQDVAYTVLSNDKNSVQLFGTVDSSWTDIDSFSDGALNGGSQDAWATDVTAGVRYNRVLRALGSAPAGVFTAQAGVTAAVGDVKSGLDLDMGSFGWRQESATRNRWGWNLGAGVDVPVNQRTSVYGTVDSVLRGDSHSIDGQVGVKVAF